MKQMIQSKSEDDADLNIEDKEIENLMNADSSQDEDKEKEKKIIKLLISTIPVAP